MGKDFANHDLEKDDCWPPTYHDEKARGKPKDGVIAVSPTGHVVKAATKVLGLLAPCEWPLHGTKHEAAIALAGASQNSVVMIRSSRGDIRVLLGSHAGMRG